MITGVGGRSSRAARPRPRRRDAGAGLRRHPRARRGRRLVHRRRPGVGAAAPSRSHRRHGTTTTMASLVTGEPRRAAGLGVDARRAVPGRRGRRHPPGRPLDQPAPLRRPRPPRAPGPGPRRDRPAADRRATGRSPWSRSPPSCRAARTPIRRLADAGVIAAVGHTDCSYAVAAAAIDAGARVATHLFNAMRPIHHRDPGPIIALLDDPRVTVELIADGIHLDPALLPLRQPHRRPRPGRAGHRRDGRRRARRRRATGWARWPSTSATGWRASPAPTRSPAAPPRWTSCSGAPCTLGRRTGRADRRGPAARRPADRDEPGPGARAHRHRRPGDRAGGPTSWCWTPTCASPASSSAAPRSAHEHLNMP